jgi:hypothetical protein
MMTIDQIKKAIKYADGFKIATMGRFSGRFEKAEYIFYMYNKYQKYNALLRENIMWAIYPLFLTRVIEGINREYSKHGKGAEIVQTSWYVEAQKDGYREQWCFKNIDQSKEAAIIWVLENES